MSLRYSHEDESMVVGGAHRAVRGSLGGNGLRVEAEHSDGERHLVLYDGKEITAFSPSQNVYAQVDKPGGIDEAFMYFLKDLNMRLPLAVLLVSRLPLEFERRTQSLDYVDRG